MLEESAVTKKTYKVNILTPMMMHGWKEDDRGKIKEKNKNAQKYVGQTTISYAELRGPSFRGVYRYWWRIVQYENMTPKQLLAKEGHLFGSVIDGGQKSRVSLSTSIKKSEKKAKLRPHNEDFKATTKSINHGEFEITLTFLKKDQSYKQELINYFELALLLGSFGQRSRRGAGAIQRTDTIYNTIEEYRQAIMKQLEKVNKQHYFFAKKKSRTHLIALNNAPMLDRPTLRNVYIGMPFSTAEAARKRISDAGHTHNSGKGKPQYLGRTVGKRKASPLICTVRKIGCKFYPIISEVVDKNTASKEYEQAKNNFLKYVGVEL